MKGFKYFVLVVSFCFLFLISGSFVHAEDGDVCKIGDVYYETLKDAVDAANAMDLPAGEFVEIEVIKDFNMTEKLTIEKDMKIFGDHVIYRTNDYVGQMFSVPAGVNFVLEDLTFDGNNHWTYLQDYDSVLESTKLYNPVYIGGYDAVVAKEDGAPVASGIIVGVGGKVTLDGVTMKNHLGQGLVWVGASGNLEIKDTLIEHNTRNGGGILGGVDDGGLMTISEGTVIRDCVGTGNGLLGNIYGKAVINGGEIYKNIALDCNGYVFMIIYNNADLVMNDGYIHDNICTRGWANGYNCAFYVYGNGARFEMNGGTISNNYSSSVPGVGNNGSNAEIYLNGGTVVDNYSKSTTDAKDMYAYCNVVATNTVNYGNSRLYGHFKNDGVWNGNIAFYKYAKTADGAGIVNGNIAIVNSAITTFASGTWNGVVNVKAVGATSQLIVKPGARIIGGPVRVLTSLTSGDDTNGTEASAAQEVAYIEEDGALVEVPVLYYHRLTSEQKGTIVVTYDYNGGLDDQNWSGIQRTTSEASCVLDSLVEPKKDGYIFTGWAKADNQSVESLDMSASEVYVPGSEITESVKYIAQWKKDGVEEFKVIFEYEGEVPEDAPAVPTSLDYEEGQVVLLTDYEIEGFKLVWDISVLDDGKMPANDVVIKGRWERIITKYSVTFEYDGEVPEGAPLLPTACEYEENETVVLPDLTLDGYELVWDTSVLVDGKMPANDVVIKGSWNKLDNSGGSSDIPDTGDTANTNLWLLLLGMSSLLGIVLFKKRYSA